MTRSLSDFRFMSGSVAACLAPYLWSGMGQRQQGLMFWDVRREVRARLFEPVLRNAAHVGVAWRDGLPAAFAWVSRSDRRIRCATTHFCFFGKKPDMDWAEHVARHFLACVRDTGNFDALLAELPAVYRHARAFAQRVGFTALGVIPGACWMETQNKCVAAAILCLPFTQKEQEAQA